MDMLTQNNLLLMNSSNNSGNKKYLSDNATDDFGMNDNYLFDMDNSAKGSKSNKTSNCLMMNTHPNMVNGFNTFSSNSNSRIPNNSQFVYNINTASIPLMDYGNTIGSAEIDGTPLGFQLDDEYDSERYYLSNNSLAYSKCNECYPYFQPSPTKTVIGINNGGNINKKSNSNISQDVSIPSTVGHPTNLQAKSTLNAIQLKSNFVTFDSEAKKKGSSLKTSSPKENAMGKSDSVIIENDNIEENFVNNNFPESKTTRKKRKTQTNSSRVRVELTLIFVKVGQVDTVNERYQADIFLQSRWREPLLDRIFAPNSRNIRQKKEKPSFKKKPCIIKDNLDKDKKARSLQDRNYYPIKKNIAFTDDEQTLKNRSNQNNQESEIGHDRSLNTNSQMRTFKTFQVIIT